MAGYICITHSTTHREEAERLCRVLKRYGFRYRRMDEEPGTVARDELIGEASAVLAVTGVTAEDTGFAVLAADMERCMARRIPLLCLSVQENELDTRYLSAADGASASRVALIPFTVGRMPDRHSVALFLHRLFIRHLATLADCFNPDRCVDDNYSRIVALAVRAHLGDGEACYALGRAYESGDRVPAIEHEAALWITRAADCGVPDARIHMGELHLLGRCRHPDPSEAYRLFSVAADAGDVRGYYHRGLCALWGLGCPVNTRQAAADLTVAASAGFAPALFRLGLLYRDGQIPAETHAYEAAVHCLYAACRRETTPPVSRTTARASESIGWIPSGATRPWTPTARSGAGSLVWTPVEARAGSTSTRAKRTANRIIAADRLIEESLSKGGLSLTRATTIGHDPLPTAPTLYSRRAGRRPQCVTLRHMRRTRLWRLLTATDPAGAEDYPGRDVAGYAPPELRRREALAARCFRHARFRPGEGVCDPNPTDWVSALLGSRSDEHLFSTTASASVAQTTADASERHDTYVDRATFDVADAALALGRLLEQGDSVTGVAPHPTRAAVWYRYAALGGNTEAFRRLGDLYRRGHGLPLDPARAAVLYAYAADHGDPEGQFARGVACERGIGTPCNPDEAFRRYREAARAGYAPAQNNLGGCYEHGIGVVPDLLAAVEWYTRAASVGQSDAQCRLGLCCESGHGVDADYPRAVRLYEAAARRGHPYALYRLGLCYERGLIEQPNNDMTAAASVAAGDVLAIPTGVPVPPLDPTSPEATHPTPHYTEAVYLWAEAARRGLSVAAYALALCYANGRGVPKDTAAYLRCLTEAAEGKHIQALYRLGLAYLEGRGTPPDGGYARRCFTRAAELWEARLASARSLMDAAETDALPTGAMTSEAAAASALYMRGYCTLYAIGETAEDAFEEAAALSAGVTVAMPVSEPEKSETAPLTEADWVYKPLHPKIRDGATDGELLQRRGWVSEGPIGAPSEPPATDPDPVRLSRAVEDFRRAADLGHVGALTALGDLYTYGLLKTTAPSDAANPAGTCVPNEVTRAADRALEYYTEAVRVGMTRVFLAGSASHTKSSPATEGWLRDDAFRDTTARTVINRAVALRGAGDLPADDPLHALLTVADRANTLAAAREAEGESGEAELTRVKVWRSLAGAAELGSVDAQVSMAACAFFGHGTPENRVASLRFLEHAETMNGGRVSASLRIGDFNRAGWCGAPNAVAADEAYLRALRTPLIGSECGAYIIAHRREARRNADRKARAEALYRIATLRAVAFPDDATRGNAFAFLAQAVLAGHTAAENDLARMYANRDQLSSVGRPGRRRYAARRHKDWMTRYYTACSLMPVPFRDELTSPPEAILPNFVTVPVTDLMRINALNYLGDCFFEGQGLTPDAASAVACYRRVVSMKLTIGRGETAPKGLAWAQYSLGWCLLKGVGTRRDDREAVRWLTAAARSHAEAAYALAECYEYGVGVDVSDEREAIKYYRKALNMGCARAEAKVISLEDRLRRQG